jgi:hypothetical protein
MRMPPEAIQLVGKKNAAATPKGMNFNTEYAKHLDKTSESYKMLDSKEMKDLTGIDYYLNGLWTPGYSDAATCSLYPVTSRWRF